MVREKMSDNGADLGFESKLWIAADKMRSNMDAAEYKHIVLGLIFLKYISDFFEERRQLLVKESSEGVDPENPNEYKSNLYGKNVFFVPEKARWSYLEKHAKQPEIGKIIDEPLV